MVQQDMIDIFRFVKLLLMYYHVESAKHDQIN